MNVNKLILTIATVCSFNFLSVPAQTAEIDRDLLCRKFPLNSRCQTDSCTITATDTLDLPPGTDIYRGLFKIEYREKDLRRSLSFRIPADAKLEAIETITVETY